MPHIEVGGRIELDHNQVAVITGISVSDLKKRSGVDKEFDWMGGKFKIDDITTDKCVLNRQASDGPSIEPSYQYNPDLTSDSQAVADLVGNILEEPLRRPKTGMLEMKIRAPGTLKGGDTVEKVDALGPDLKSPRPRPFVSVQVNEPSDSGRHLSSINQRAELLKRFYRVGYPLVLARK